MIIVSADPGTKNFACAVTEHKLVNGRLISKVIATGMIDTTITNLNQGIIKDIRRFEKQMRTIRDTYQPDLVYFERFQSRGLKGTTIECINIMLGVMIMVFRKQDPKLLLASTWKNRIGKRVDLKSSYRDYGFLGTGRNKINKSAHELDATLIGFYGACRHFGIPDFEPFHEGNWPRFIEWFLERPDL